MNNNSKLESSKSPPLRAIINGQEIACELETLDLHLDGLWLVGTIGGIPFKCHRAMIFAMQHEQAIVDRMNTLILAAHGFFCLYIQYPISSPPSFSIGTRWSELAQNVHINISRGEFQLLSSLEGKAALSNVVNHRFYPENLQEWLGPRLRLSNVNHDYKVCHSYPHVFACPTTISDATLRHAAKYRARQRLPIFSYQHYSSGGVIFRCAQPLAGLAGHRSIQDERLVEAIRQLTPRRQLMVLDARNARSAYLNAVNGGGMMPLDNYPDCERQYLDMENIHGVRTAYWQTFQLIIEEKASRRKALEGAGWLQLYTTMMKGVARVIELVLEGWAVLIHCSDGWDRTAQLVSLAQICLQPRYRTILGLIHLIEREWIKAGHQFDTRLARLVPLNALSFTKKRMAKINGFLDRITTPSVISSNYTDEESTDDEFSPIFPQFLDALRQLIRVYPTAFEFNHLLIDEIEREVWTMRYATFAGDSEAGRKSRFGDYDDAVQVRSMFWYELLKYRERFLNSSYDPEFPNPLSISKDVITYL